jgi:Flp pilus assembly protein TadD
VRQAAPLLVDPVRAVRIEAARVLTGAPEASLDVQQRRVFDAAVGELTGAHAAMADMPASHVAMGRLQERRGEREAAAASYATALRMDPRLLPARLDLAALDRRMQRDGEAERVLREGLGLTPAQGELHYALGLLLAGQRRLPEAADALAEAVRRLPDSARVHYNHGVALEHLGRLADAERALQRAVALDGDDPDVVYALVTVFLRQGQYRRALEQAERLTHLTPDDAAARGLVERLRREIAAPPRARE